MSFSNILARVDIEEIEIIDIRADNSFSLIDNIFIQNYVDILPGIIPSDISDHYLIFAICKNLIPSNSSKVGRVVEYRLLNENNMGKLHDAVSECNFGDILEASDVNIGTSMFNNRLMDLYNTNCPVISKTVSYKDLVKPWIDNDTKLKMRKRQEYLTLYKLGKMSKEAYCRYRNFVTAAIRNKKTQYYEKRFSEIKGSLHATWRLINNVIKPNSDSRSQTMRLSRGDEIVCDPPTLVELFNDYFSTIGSRIKNSVSGSVTDFESFPSGNYINSFFLSPVSPDQIHRAIHGMKSKSCRPNEIPMSVL